MSDHDDEFEAYDFSEFTDQDLRAVDAMLARRSPFSAFIAPKKHLAVTDLVAPIWCEVQFEYGLYGRRNKPPHLRPSAFLSRRGKTIHVHQQLAHASDRRLERGKSVHSALEHELRPQRTLVHVASDEERFGLRLVQLLDGFTQLVSERITRELPVFTITHAHVVLGTIDEVLSVPVSSSAVQLRLRDHKTRRSPNIPVDQDALSSRLQLMLYHRMLSTLLAPEAFDFALLWTRLGLDPTKPFSPQFLKDIACTADGHVHLNYLVSEWTSTVQRHRPHILGVSQHLQLVYRRSPQDTGKQKASEPADIEDPLDALVLQEELELALAIEQSLSDIAHQATGQVARHVGPSSPGRTAAIVSPSDPDPTLACALQQSLLDCAHKASTLHHLPSEEQPKNGTTADISPIIGTREFTMDDDELDARLADVLQWWLGARPPRGVDLNQTHRCFTCEYQDACEWREQKAREAVALASERRSQRSDTGSNSNSTSVWPTTRPEVA